jgi:hypothetical protein
MAPSAQCLRSLRQPTCANPYNNLDVRNPLVNFNDFFDGDNLVQEDLVIWANIAMHHVPIVSDPLRWIYPVHAKPCRLARADW